MDREAGAQADKPSTGAKKHEIVVEPLGISLFAYEGETVVEAAARQGVRWPGVCGGIAECGVCAFELLSNEEDMAPPTAIEGARLRRLRRRPDAVGPLRLACQIRVHRDIHVHKPGVRAPRN